jgi:hypothetical protein
MLGCKDQKDSKLYDLFTEIEFAKGGSNLLKFMPGDHENFQLNFSSEELGTLNFIYAGFCESGTHPIIIYDPKSGNFYQKTAYVLPRNGKTFSVQTDQVKTEAIVPRLPEAGHNMELLDLDGIVF